MNDQRHSERLTLEDTTVDVVDQESGVEFQGLGRDVSDGGLRFEASMEPPVGADMDVRLSGSTSLKGKMKVIRVAPRQGRYEVAGLLSRAR
ncbi:MAG: PilZ domain-containing protein [Myxococcaceae bacterium]